MSIVTLLDRWGVRGGTAANLAAVNEIPLKQEMIVETDTLKFKFGDGVTHYNSLAYGGTVSDGDKGDLTVSVGGTVWTIDADAITTAKIANDAVTYAKIQNVSATDKVLGRSTAGAGDVEEITCTSFARSLLDDTTAAAARATLGITSAGTAFDPSSSSSFFDEFNGFPVSNSTFYTNQWGCDVVGGGVTSISGGGGHPGVIRADCGAGGVCAFSRGNPNTVVNQNINNITLGAGEHIFEWYFRIPTLSDATNRFSVTLGFRSSFSGSLSDGIYVAYQDNLNSGKLFMRTLIGGVQKTDAVSSTTVVANTWYRVRVVINAAGTSASLYINGSATPDATTTDPLPTAAMRNGVAINRSVGGALRQVDLDYYYETTTFTTPR